VFDNAPDWLPAVRDDWQLLATEEFGFGVVPDLDGVLTDSVRRELLLQLSKRALKRLEAFGDPISAATLNALGAGKSGGGFPATSQRMSFWNPHAPSSACWKTLRTQVESHRQPAPVDPPPPLEAPLATFRGSDLSKARLPGQRSRRSDSASATLEGGRPGTGDGWKRSCGGLGPVNGQAYALKLPAHGPA
jgi:hypothetical protein